MEETVGSEDIIICRDVHKWYGDFHALRGITTTIKKREVVVVFGPSGSGKSTFIRTINRLEEHQSGDIIVDGVEMTDDVRNIDAIRRDVGMVFQSFNLFPHLTVMSNITLAPIKVRHIRSDEAEDIAMSPAGACGYTGAGGQVPGGALRRSAAARCHSARAGYAAEDHAVRRADVGAGP